MKIVLKLVAYSFILLFLSCMQSDNLEGDCPSPPQLSSKKLIFNKNGGTQEVSVSESYRYNISYNSIGINLYEDGEDLKITESENFTEYKHDDFIIETYELKVVVTMNENTGDNRELYMEIASGNCFTGFEILQEGE